MPHRLPISDLSRLAIAGAILLASASGSALACIACSEDWGDDSLRWNASTGQDLLNFPPDRVVDFEHMRLELDIPDMNSPTLTGKATLSFTALAPTMRSFKLDAHQMSISNVYAIGRGQAVDYSYDDEQLTLVFEPPLKRGDTGGVVIEYEINDPPEGLLWNPESPDTPGRAAQIHTQGQPDTNSFWYPCHDSPNERLTTEILCTVPEGNYVSSNGRLVSETTTDGRTTFHWNQDLPHVNYLVSLCVGQWDIVDITETDLPMPVYVPKGMGKHVQGTYGRTPAMVEAMAAALDEPYPWAQYGQVLVWNFGAGGMENTSVTTMFEAAILEDPSVERDLRRLDSLIAHELGHQWFGDLITCNSWDHIWLNEGFATYMEALWWEACEGYDNGYLFDIWENNRSSAGRDKTPAVAMRPGMVSREYGSANDVFRRKSNPYPKGASILHMLRSKLGDEAFFDGLRGYVDEYKYKTVETSDFRKSMENASGLSLERFFEQWAFRPGTPEVTVTSSWDLPRKTLSIKVEQTQRVDSAFPAFSFDLPIHIVTDKGARLETLRITERLFETTISLDSEPAMVAVDPWLATLASRSFDCPSAWLIEQLRSGPTIPSRLDAAIALREHPGKTTTEALTAVLNDSSAHQALRVRCAESLGDLNAGDELMALINAGVNGDSRVRVAMLEALATTGHEGALPILLAVAQDQSLNHRVRAAAIEGIGTLGDRSHLGVLTDALNEGSYTEAIRAAAIGALVEMNEPEAIAAIAPLTGEGFYPRFRPIALNAMVDLADHDPDLAFHTIKASLTSRVERARNAAASALADLGDERGLPLLRRQSRSHRQPAFREHCAKKAKELAANHWNATPNADLTKEIEGLRQELEELRDQVEQAEEK